MVTEDNDNIIHNLSKLKWACRRGMLELDVLLGNFLQKGYSTLSEEEKKAFVDLLSYPDPELFDCLMGQAEPDSEVQAAIIIKIRFYAQPRI